jgi:hypothetical protein
MRFTIEMLSRYLGMPASRLLADAPFKDWAFERTLETDLPRLEIDYVFANNGMDFRCDEADTVCTIFIYADNVRHFKNGLEDMPFRTSRRELTARLGPPASSGEGHIDSILGEYGPWDRFACEGFALHVSFSPHVDEICLVTLMRDDVAP